MAWARSPARTMDSIFSVVRSLLFDSLNLSKKVNHRRIGINPQASQSSVTNLNYSHPRRSRILVYLASVAGRSSELVQTKGFKRLILLRGH